VSLPSPPEKLRGKRNQKGKKKPGKPKEIWKPKRETLEKK
jgi:hypothetical protein